MTTRSNLPMLLLIDLFTVNVNITVVSVSLYTVSFDISFNVLCLCGHLRSLYSKQKSLLHDNFLTTRSTKIWHSSFNEYLFI